MIFDFSDPYDYVSEKKTWIPRGQEKGSKEQDISIEGFFHAMEEQENIYQKE